MKHKRIHRHKIGTLGYLLECEIDLYATRIGGFIRKEYNNDLIARGLPPEKPAAIRLKEYEERLA